MIYEVEVLLCYMINNKHKIVITLLSSFYTKKPL